MLTLNWQSNRVFASLRRVWCAEEGQDMIEYALLGAIVSVSAVAIIILMGPALKVYFQDIVNATGLF